jgi:hypothetical protein
LRDVRAELGCNDAEARTYIMDRLAQLTDSNFHERVIKQEPSGVLQFDVYRSVDPDDDQLEWYVKIRIETNGTLIVASFHAPEHPMTSGGRHGRH